MEIEPGEPRQKFEEDQKSEEAEIEGSASTLPVPVSEAPSTVVAQNTSNDRSLVLRARNREKTRKDLVRQKIRDRAATLLDQVLENAVESGPKRIGASQLAIEHADKIRRQRETQYDRANLRKMRLRHTRIQ